MLSFGFLPGWIKPFQVPSQLFGSYEERLRCHSITARLSKWITICIAMCYTTRGRAPPRKLKAHSTRVHSASAAFMYIYLMWTSTEQQCRPQATCLLDIMHLPLHQGKAQMWGCLPMRRQVQPLLITAWRSPSSAYVSTWRKNGYPTFCNCSSRCFAYVLNMTHPPSPVKESLSSLFLCKGSEGRVGQLCPLYPLPQAWGITVSRAPLMASLGKTLQHWCARCM